MINRIIEWAESELPDWQSDAVRRLLTQDQLTEMDKIELITMLKAKHGLVASSIPIPTAKPLKRGEVSGAPQTTAKIVLKAMTDLTNVNAIPDGSKLLFGHEGLTVIYGDNAAGKSGYARILKKACRARDVSEHIYPNIFKETPITPAKAKFKISINDKDRELSWEDGLKNPDELANIAVFDSKCSRVIVDEKNEFSYRPYGSHVFGGLVRLLQELRSRLDNEKPKIEPPQYPDIPSTTEVGKFIAQLNHEITDISVENFAKWTLEDGKKLTEIEKNLAQAQVDNPIRQAQMIRARKNRINDLNSKIRQIDSTLSESNSEILKQQIKNLNAAEQALAIASKQSLAQEPLRGAGEDTWRQLYEAAKQYSIQYAYPGKEFPYTDKDSRCVFCMEFLSDDGKRRLQRFKEFMEKTTKKELDLASQILETTISKIKGIDFKICETYKDALNDILNKEAIVAERIKEYISAMETRAGDMIKTGVDKEVSTFAAIKPSPCESIERITQQFELEATAVEKTAKPAELERLKSQRDDLTAKKLFTERKEKVLDFVEKLRLVKRYENCIDETKHYAITEKGNKIVSEALTPQLMSVLNDELNALGVKHLKLSLKKSGSYGETLHKMELPDTQYHGGIKLTEILSEGEQHIVGIAGFLAELKVAGHKGPIVLDDPVCSLDHRYREKVAERLVQEATCRQVIIFTHDIAFLLDLQIKAENLGNVVKFLSQTIRYDESPGKCYDGLPWHSMPVSKRLNYLNEKLQNVLKLYPDNLLEYNLQAAHIYGLLRETWEATIEEVLFHRTIRRFASEVHTLELRYVNVTDDNYKKIYLAMAKCSKWMFGHDKTKATDENRPSPEEIQKDINALSDFVQSVNSYAKIIEQQRKELLKLQTPAIG